MNTTPIRINPATKKEIDRLMPYECIKQDKRSLTYAEFVDIVLQVYKANNH